MGMRTSTRQVGDVTIVDISGRIVFGEERASVHGIVRDLLGKGHTKILLNLGAVDYIDGMGLGSLLSAFASARKQGGEKLFCSWAHSYWKDRCMHVAQKLSCLPATIGKETSRRDCRVLLRQVRLEGLVRSVRGSILLFLVPQIREQLYRGGPVASVVVVGEGK